MGRSKHFRSHHQKLSTAMLFGSLWVPYCAVFAQQQPEVIHMFSGASARQSTLHDDVDMQASYKARAMDLNEKGLQLFFKGQPEAAIAKLKVALGHDPNNPTILYNLAGFYLTEQKPEASIELMRRAIRFEPDDLSFHTRLAEAYVMDGQLEGAIESYSRVVQVDPTFNRAIVKLGTLYAMDDRFEEAEATLKKAHVLFGDAPDVLSSLGSALVMEGKNKAAIEVLTKCQEVEKSAENEVALGLAYESLGERVKALSHYKNAAKMGEANQELQQKISDLQALLSSTAEADSSPADAAVAQ